MPRFFKHLALLVAVACFTWVAVLWHWQATQRDMSVRDIGMYLVALPLVLFTLLLLGRWAWAGVAAGGAAAAAAAANASATSAAPAAESADETERRACVQLLAAAVLCTAGRSADDVLAAAREGQPRPALDPELRDEQGLPLMSARLRGLDPDATVPDPDGRLRPEARRALAALADPLAQAVAALQPWQALFEPPAADDLPPGATRSRVDTTPLPTLRVMALWPADFSDTERQQAEAWAQAQLREGSALPAARIAWQAAPSGPAWPEVERLLRLLAREGRQDMLLLLATHSALGDAHVRRLETTGQLFTSRHPQRPIVGEGAVALLLAPANFPAAPGDDTPPPVLLHRAALVQRDKPIDAPGRSTPAWAQRCLEGALACGGANTAQAVAAVAAQVAAAVHDADQHTARAAEALGALLQVLPHLQPADDVVQTGALTGQLGAVAPLLAVALAAQQARTLGQPCLALSVDDARWRLALLARPADFDLSAVPLGTAPEKTP